MYIPRHVNFTTLRSAWFGHIPFGYDLVKGFKPNTIVELGTHYGGSYFAFCDSVNNQKSATKCYAVDTWQGEEQAGFYDESVYRFVNGHNRRFDNFSKLLRCKFDEAVNQFDSRSIDLLHIDGFHSYEAVHNDFSTWLPKVSNSGIILFHDVMEKKEGFGVHQLWSELKQTYQDQCFEFEHSHGLGVLSLDQNVTIFDKLFRITKVPTNRLQSHYENKARRLSKIVKLFERFGLQKQL